MRLVNSAQPIFGAPYRVGTLVYGGIPGQSSYYTTQSALFDSGLSRESLFQSLQVNPHPVFGYRPQIGVYEVLSPINVPSGIVSANPSIGVGGSPQFFIRDFNNKLNLINKIDLRNSNGN